jgi:hypothetical protein
MTALEVRDETSDAVAYPYEAGGQPLVLLFSGRKRKPDGHFRFRSDEERQTRIAKHFDEVRRVAALKAERKEKAKAPHTLKVGDIMVSSWGWEQTNVDFYQIVSVTPKTVTMREIEQAQTESEGGWTGRVVAVKDRFKADGKTKTCRANHENYLSLNSHSGASLWDGQPRYFSTYA